MTHRERIIAALSHKQPDVVPIDLGGSRDSSIVVEGYEKLKKHFGIESENELCDRMMQVVKVDERILRKLHIDTRSIFPGTPIKSAVQGIAPDKYRDAWGVDRIQPRGSYYYDQINYPLSGERTISDILKYPWPDPSDPGYIKGLHKRAQWIKDNTECAAVLTVPAPFVHITQYLRGFEDWYCDFVLNKGFIEALFDAVLEITMEFARRELEEVGKEVDVVFCADDLGTQRSLQVNRSDYLKFIKPRHEKYFRQIHELSPAKLVFHSCGSVVDVIDDFIEIGVDVLNPVQVSAAGMNPAELKKKYKSRLAFWGAMDNENILPTGTVNDVKRMVEERIEQMGEGGGYVLSSCHNIQPDVPIENILVMFEHARQYVPSYMK